MALITAYNNVTLAEAQRSVGWDPGSLGELQRRYAFTDNVPWYPTNRGLTNRQVQADRLPSITAGKLNGSIGTGAGGRSVIEEPVKLYQLESHVDERLLKGMTAEQAQATRDSEDEMIMEGCLGGVEGKVIYGNDGSSPDDLRGLALRRPSIGTYCLNMGGTASGSMCSAWLIELGRKGFHFGYPPGTVPGLTSEDKGLQRVASVDGAGDYYAWCRLYEFWGAVILRDNRALIRIANIGSATPLTADKVIEGRNILPGMGRDAALFVNRSTKTAIDKAAYNKTNLSITTAELPGYGAVSYIGGVPVLLSEAILDTDTTVS
jgi:hypothetical protein